MAPDPLSYNMSDVNPHLTQCEPPPYLKAGSAPAGILINAIGKAKTSVDFSNNIVFQYVSLLISKYKPHCKEENAEKLKTYLQSIWRFVSEAVFTFTELGFTFDLVGVGHNEKKIQYLHFVCEVL